MMENVSLWRGNVEFAPRARLDGDLNTDVAIIGGGMTGVLIAHCLKRRGVRAVILEANRLCGGQTQNTTAKITSQHGMIYDALTQKFGAEKAGQYAQANESAIRAFAALIDGEGIDCDFKRVPAYLYSATAAAPMEREAEAAKRAGIDARFVNDARLPFAVAGAVVFDGQARFHPLKFVRAVSRELSVFEDTPVVSVKDDCAFTPRGTVRAKHIVFACHYPFINIPGWYFLRMHQERSYVIALESDFLPEGMYYGVDNDGLSLRTAEGLLLVSGENHRTGENSRGGRYDALLRRARACLPVGGVTARWSAQDCVTLDGVPYIGRFSESTPNWYVATGFAKWGMSTSMAAAQIISGQIMGDAPEWADVFSPARFALSASAKSFANDTAQAFKGLAREFLSVPKTTLNALAPGHGGIVEVDGKKAGVYKDEMGKCYIINPRCPHLGCQLEWNPDERSYDCPCHGSRFRFDGALLSGPAKEDLL